MHDKVEIDTIMVVDDTPANLKLLQEMLQARGYRVIAFPNGRMALAAAAKHPPDLILLDILMPGMSGFEVCQQLKAHDELKEIPVLFISALGETTDKVKAFAMGGLDYVTKPFQFEEVNARIQAHLELRRQRRQLQEAYDNLRELERLRDNLTHMIVHDMRSPLTVVLGSLDLLRRQLPDDPAALRRWQMSRSAAESLVTMCNELLDVSRLESGQMPVLHEPCNLRDLIDDSLSATQTQADFAHVTLLTEARPVHVSADKGLVQRVLNNLLTNAIKHTPGGGQVIVRAAESDDGALVEVADTGRGIPIEYHGRIFDKFGQVESRQDGKKHSTGLGLTFCKLAIEAHRGSIGVTSKMDHGSVFWFTLPDRLAAESARN